MDQSGRISIKSTALIFSLAVAFLWPLEILAFRSGTSFWQSTLMFVFGNNQSGELGIGNFTNQPVPVLAHGHGPWKKIVGRDHVLALKHDGTLWAWGKGNMGQLGNGGTASKEVPVQVPGGPWIDIGGGMNHSLAIDSSGRLFAWGSDSLGQLGNGSGGPSTVTSPQMIDSGPWDKVGVTTGDNSCAIRQGKLFTWGENLLGGLGLGDSNPRHIPTQVGSLSDWQACAGGYYHMLGLRSGGQLYAWGANNDGQVGNGGTATVFTSFQISGTWQSIGAGLTFSLALRSDGKLFTWGSNDYGELGWGSPNGTPHPVPTEVSGAASQWKKVFAGESQVYGLGIDGSLWVWGQTAGGRLGEGTTSNNSRPPFQLPGYWHDLIGGYKGAFGFR